MGDFHGAKLALLNGDHVLAYLRDDFADLPFPAHWDFPGGGREGEETPEACVLRELQEEFGLVLPPERLLWRRKFNWTHRPERSVWFFGGFINRAEIGAIRFGDEGQFWEMMPTAAFLAHERAVGDLQARLQLWLDDQAARPS